MSEKDAYKQKRTNLPWLKQDPELDKAVHSLVQMLKNTKTKRPGSVELDEKSEQRLKRQFKDAEHGRTTAGKYMRAIALELGHEDPDLAYIVAGMKDWDRVKDKFVNAARDVRDLGRGSVYINSIEEYRAFHSILKSKTKDGIVKRLNVRDVRIIEGSMDDYLANPRKSGYAGSINFNIEIDLGKGRHGTFEIQVRPSAYQDIDKKSHRLYDLIRLLQEVPGGYLTPSDHEVMDALVTANQALFEEHAWRYGFDEINKNKPLEISYAQMRSIKGILDRLRTTIENLPGRNFAWKSETADALTYAKTSVDNVYEATQGRNGADPTVYLD